MGSRQGSLWQYAAERLLQAVPLILIVIIVNFVIIHAAPGDPVRMVIGEGTVSQEYIEQTRRELGLDRPLHEQLLMYIGNVARGDLGNSYVYRQPVLGLIVERIPATLLLALTSLVLSSIVGILAGVVASRREGSVLDNVTMVLALAGYSTPVFFIGLVALLVFSLYLGWFPTGGFSDLRAASEGLDHVVDVVRHLVLPAVTLAIFNLALVSRITRASMLEVLRKDYITTARSKGMPENRVVYRHALPNALLPVITVIGLNFGYLLSGAVLTEIVFAWPGLGRLAYQAVGQRDYQVLLGMFVVTSVMVITANLITDLCYLLINPRIRFR